MIGDLGLKVSSSEGLEALLSDCKDVAQELGQVKLKNVGQGNRELWNLAWDMKNGVEVARTDGVKRSNRGKTLVK